VTAVTSEGTTIEGEGKRTRAAALPPSERRAEIIAATLPLVREHGANVTTRQIAEAAGIDAWRVAAVGARTEVLAAAAGVPECSTAVHVPPSGGAPDCQNTSIGMPPRGYQ